MWGLALFFAVIFVFSFQITAGNNYLTFGLLRTFPSISLYNNQNSSMNIATKKASDFYQDLTKESDALRDNTQNELIGMIKQHPFCGNGLGASIPLRPAGLVEYIYHDILNKIGLIGLLLYLFPVIYMISQLIKTFKLKEKGWIIKLTWLSGLWAFLVATYFNPYMNSSLGICFYGLCIAAFMIKFQDPKVTLDFFEKGISE